MKTIAVTFNDVTNNVRLPDRVWRIYNDSTQSKKITRKTRDKILAHLGVFHSLTIERRLQFYPNGFIGIGRVEEPVRHVTAYDDILLWFVFMNESGDDVLAGDLWLTGAEAKDLLSCLEGFDRKYQLARKTPKRCRTKPRG